MNIHFQGDTQDVFVKAICKSYSKFAVGWVYKYKLSYGKMYDVGVGLW